MYEYLLEKYKKHKLIFGVFLGFLSVSFAVLLNLNSMDVCSSHVILILSIIPIIPVLTKVIEKVEEFEELSSKDILNRYFEYVKFYFSLFFGMALAYYVWFVITKNPVLFLSQITAIREIYNEVTAMFFVFDAKLFYLILMNNLKVLLISFILSFIFGAGAIYIISWNASILGVFLALEAFEYKSNNIVVKYFLYPGYKLLRILPHGIFEFSSFFLAALAGNSLGILMIKGYSFRDERFHRVLADAVVLFILSVMLLVIAAFIEAL